MHSSTIRDRHNSAVSWDSRDEGILLYTTINYIYGDRIYDMLVVTSNIKYFNQLYIIIQSKKQSSGFI